MFGRLICVTCMMLTVVACSSPYSAVPQGASAIPAASGLPRSSPPLASYRIGPRDVLALRVTSEPDLTIGELPVSADGQVAIPLIGEIQAVGRTSSELSAEIDRRLIAGHFLRAPRSAILVMKAVNYTFTIDGAVMRPGVYDIPGTLTLAQALAVGSGAAQYAKLNEIVVVREVDGQRYAARFDLIAIRTGRAPDFQLQQSDLVIVGFDAVDRLFNTIIGNLPAAAAVFVAVRN